MTTRNFYGIREKKPRRFETPDGRNHLIGTRMETRPGIVKDNTTAQGNPVTHIGHLKSDDCNALFKLAITDDGVLQTLPFPTTFLGGQDNGYISGSDSTYSTARTTATSFYASNLANLLVQQWVISGNYTVSRVYILFDTSSIPDNATIKEAKLKMAIRLDNSETDFDVIIHKYDWEHPITDDNKEANYDGALAATDGAVTWRNTSGISTYTFYDSPLLDTSWINKTGFTKYVLLSGKDVDAIAPTGVDSIGFAFEGSLEGYNSQLIVQYE